MVAASSPSSSRHCGFSSTSKSPAAMARAAAPMRRSRRTIRTATTMPAAAPIRTASSADSTIERLTMSSSVATSGLGE